MTKQLIDRDEVMKMFDYLSKKCLLKAWNGCGYMVQILEDAKHRVSAIPTIESQWIDVKDRLPEQAGEYLVFDPEDSLISDYFINEEWQYTKPTHWMELPQTPIPLPPSK